MKLSEVFGVGTFTEYDQAAVQRAIEYLQDGETLTSLEGGKFSLLKKDDTYALVRTKDAEILGWVVLEPYNVANIDGLSLKMIYIRLEFRKSVAASILLFSAKQHLNKPIIVDGPVSKEGQQLLKAVSDRPRYFIVKYVNVATGTETLYNASMLQPYDKDHVIILEQRGQVTSNLYEDIMPGGYVHKFILSFFDDADHAPLL